MRAMLTCLTVVLTVAGCAGDGSRLDGFGVPVEHPEYPSLATFEGASFPPTLAAIQRFFFNSHCVSCHGGGSAPRDLTLDEGESLGHLINVAASERPDLMRIKPGDPDASYLVMKLEGAAGIVGRQMPRRAPARPQGEIDIVRTWIANGCPEQ